MGHWVQLGLTEVSAGGPLLNKVAGLAADISGSERGTGLCDGGYGGQGACDAARRL